jgi:hypothetical protein
VPLRGSATITVSGSAPSHGTLKITLRGRVKGTLGGHRVSTNLLASAVARARAIAAGMHQDRFEPFASSVAPTG